MDILSYPLTRIAKGKTIRIERAAGKGVVAFSGMAWITQQDNARDIFLRRGESFTFDRPGLAVVEALADADLVVFDESIGTEHRSMPVRVRQISEQVAAYAA